MRKSIIAGIDFLFQAARPFLGRSGVCIYPINCPDYARIMLEHVSIVKACWYISLRVLSCNPITALIWRLSAYLRT